MAGNGVNKDADNKFVIHTIDYDSYIYFDAYSKNTARASGNIGTEARVAWGHIVGSLNATTLSTLSRHGYQYFTNTSTRTTTPYTNLAECEIYAFAINDLSTTPQSSTWMSPYLEGMYHIGLGLTTEEVWHFSRITEGFQTALGRYYGRDLEDETKLYKKNILENGGTISQRSLWAVNNFVRELKNSGIWGKIVDMGVYCGDNLNAALTKLKYTNESGPYLKNYGFTNADYVERGPNGGLKGNGVNKYLDTNLKSNYLPSNSCSLSSYNRNTTKEYDANMGAQTSSTSSFALDYPNTVNDMYYRTFGWVSNGYIASSAGSVGNGYGHIMGTTVGTNSYLMRNGGTYATKSTTAGVMPAGVNLYVFTTNDNGTPSTPGGSCESFYHYGYGLTQAEGLLFYNAIWWLQHRLNRAAK